MEDYRLFRPKRVASVWVENRIVMALMTRCRAIGNVPNDLMAKYYGQRSGAGLIITEGTSPSQMDWDMPAYQEFTVNNRWKAGKRLLQQFTIAKGRYLFN